MTLVPVRKLAAVLKQKYNLDISYTGLVWYRNMGFLQMGIKQGKNNLYDPKEVYDRIRRARILSVYSKKGLLQLTDNDAMKFRENIKEILLKMFQGVKVEYDKKQDRFTGIATLPDSVLNRAIEEFVEI